MLVEFTKMHGLGNDFVVIDRASDGSLPTSQQWQRLADRRTGIGFDQALVLEPPRRAGTSVYYRIFNADGGEVEQCGNGVRCIAALLRTTGRALPDGNGEILLDSPAGVMRARAGDAGLTAVNMGVPDFRPAALPFAADAESASYRLEGPGLEGPGLGGPDEDGRVEVAVVSMGNPHAVLRVADVATAPVARLGPLLERHARFAKRVNVGFMQVIARDRIALRVFERGVGETRACGTGACAAVAVGRRDGELDEHVSVQLPGGTLRVHWRGPGAALWLEGPTEVSFRGQFEI